MTDLVLFENRGVVRVSGPDAAALLDGLFTRNVGEAGADRAIFAALLTPQGKFLADVYILSPQADTYLLDVPEPENLTRRLMMYRLRAKAMIENLSADWAVGVVWDRTGLPDDVSVYADPRHLDMPHRFMGPRAGLVPLAKPEEALDRYDAQRHGLGVPDLARDLLTEKDFILEGLMDEMGGVDFKKGCYVGQEMTSRMKRRTTVRSKLCRIEFAGPEPAFDAPISADGWEVGRIRTTSSGQGLALIRFDRVDKARADGHVLAVDGQPIKLTPPDWMVVPEMSSAD